MDVPLIWEGTLPSELSCDLLRVGPGVFTRFGKTVKHVFEADGVVTRIRFQKGEAFATSKVLRSDGYREEEAAGKRLYGSSASFFHRSWRSAKRIRKSSGNTSLLSWNGGLFALMEASVPLELDPRTLEVIKQTDLGLGIDMFGAHPHVDDRGVLWNLSMEFGPKPNARVIRWNPNQSPEIVARIPLPKNALLHDFIVVGRYLILPLMPVRTKLWKLALGIARLEDMYVHDPKMDAQLAVMSLDAPYECEIIPCEPFYAWHLAAGQASTQPNAHELNANISRYADFDTMFAVVSDTKRDGSMDPSKHRLQIDLQNKKAHLESTHAHHYEFPVPFVDCGTSSEVSVWRSPEGAEGWSLENAERRHVLAMQKGERVSEMLPSSRENPSHFLALVNRDDQTSVVVVDGKRFEICARAKLPYYVPDTYHGVVLPVAMRSN